MRRGWALAVLVGLQAAAAILVDLPHRWKFVDGDAVPIGFWLKDPATTVALSLAIPFVVLVLARLGGVRLAALSLAMLLVHPIFLAGSMSWPGAWGCPFRWLVAPISLVTCVVEGPDAAEEHMTFPCEGTRRADFPCAPE